MLSDLFQPYFQSGSVESNTSFVHSAESQVWPVLGMTENLLSHPEVVLSLKT